MQRNFPRGLARTFATSTLLIGVVALYSFTPTPAQASFASGEFTDSAGTSLSAYAIGDDLFVTITDANRNTDAATAQSVELTLSTSTAADAEPMTVANGRAATETGVNTGVFRNTTGYTTALKDGSVAVNDGVLEVEVSDTILMSYTDPSGESVVFDFTNSPLVHVGREAGHIDDGSAADDPTVTSCADAGVYLGDETTINFNDPANGGYIPTDRTKWDVQPSSKAGVNDGPTVSNITTENSTYESNKSITAGVTNPTGCHGWSFHEFEFDVSPFTPATLASLDIFWRGTATNNPDGGEPAASNDLFLLANNRTSNTWVQQDVEASISALDPAGPPYTNLTLSSSLTTSLSDYIDSNGVLRLLVAEYSATITTAVQGGLYTDYVRVTANGQDTATDSIALAGGSIFGKVWNDLDRDGVLDSNEPGLSNVTVSLLDDTGTFIVSDSTDSNGDYGFIGFPAATYNLLETDPAGFTSTTPNDLGPLVLAGGQTITDQDFGDAQQLSTTGLTTGYTVGTFLVLFAGGLGLLFVAPRLRRSFKKS